MNSPAQAPFGAVLLGHGSREPQTRAEMIELEKSLAEAHPDWQFTHAFLNGDPDVAAAAGMLVESGCRTVRVLPLLVFAGKHLLTDVPEIAQALRARHPGVAFETAPHLAVLPGFREMLAELLSPHSLS